MLLFHKPSLRAFLTCICSDLFLCIKCKPQVQVSKRAWLFGLTIEVNCLFFCPWVCACLFVHIWVGLDFKCEVHKGERMLTQGLLFPGIALDEDGK
jgi:hypothetical protein